MSAFAFAFDQQAPIDRVQLESGEEDVLDVCLFIGIELGRAGLHGGDALAGGRIGDREVARAVVELLVPAVDSIEGTRGPAIRLMALLPVMGVRME